MTEPARKHGSGTKGDAETPRPVQPGGTFTLASRFPPSHMHPGPPRPTSPHVEDFLQRDHIPGPVYKVSKSESPRGTKNGVPLSPSKTMTQTLPVGHPGRERTAWMLGAVRNNVAYYRTVSEVHGPDYIDPAVFTLTRPNPPRTVMAGPASTKSPTKSLSRSAPLPSSSDPSRDAMIFELPDINATHPAAPSYSFARPKADEASAGESHTKNRSISNAAMESLRSGRTGFITGSIKDGFLYQTVPPEGPPRHDAEKLAEALKAQEEKSKDQDHGLFKTYCLSTVPVPPRPRLSKANRFGAKQYLYGAGLRPKRMPLAPDPSSPGPKYFPTLHELGAPQRYAKVNEGKWVP